MSKLASSAKTSNGIPWLEQYRRLNELYPDYRISRSKAYRLKNAGKLQTIKFLGACLTKNRWVLECIESESGE